MDYPVPNSDARRGFVTKAAAIGAELLLVEDDDDVRRALERVLDHAGYGVVSVSTMAEARIMVEQRDFEVAVVDFRLPDGTGADLVEDLVARDPICRSVVVTGAIGAEPAAHAARVGAHAYVRKPVDVRILLHAIQRTLESTRDWRGHLALADGRGARQREGPAPVGLDIGAAVARLRHLGRLTPVGTLTAWRLLWGDSNREIADVLGVSERTAKYHVAEVLSRTRARTRGRLLRTLLLDARVDDPWAERVVDLQPPMTNAPVPDEDPPCPEG